MSSTFATPLNNVGSTLGSPYVAGSGTLVLHPGDGALVAARLAALGAPAVSASHPIRLTVIKAGAGEGTDDPTALTIFRCTGLAGDTLSGVAAIEGTTDRDYQAADLVEAYITAGALYDLQAAVGALEGLEATTVYTTGSYADPAWITSLSAAKLAGSIAESQVTGLVSDLAALSAAVAAKATDTAVVHLTGNETIAGIKTFTSPIAGTITGAIAESQVTGLAADLAAKASDSLVVHLAGVETISGAKTFSSTITGSVSGSAGTITGSIAESQVTGLVSDLAAKAADSAVVHLTGNETIAGIKTFSSTVVASISGNAGTATNGVVTTGSYADPAWISSLAGSKISGNITGNAASITGAIAESQVTGLVSDLAAKAADSSVVHLTGNETIAGIKTFSSTITGSVSGNAGTATNGVVTTGSYADPAWISSLAGSKVSGNIGGNAANVTGTVAIANGGTGQATANAAFNALAPTQTSNSGKFLTTDGSSTSWGAAGGLAVGGAVTGGTAGDLLFVGAGPVLAQDGKLAWDATNHKLGITGQGNSTTSPSTITGLLAWWKADSLGLADGAAVSAWSDSSSNANNLAQATGANQPVFKAGQINGKPVVRFDGVNDYLSFTTRLTTIQTAFFVVKWAGSLSGQRGILLGDSTTYDWYGGNGPALWDETFAASNLQTGAAYSNGASHTPLSINKPAAYKILGVVAAGNLAAERLTNDRSGAQWWNGDYAEVLLYSAALGSTDLQKVLDYLGDKYAIEVANTTLTLANQVEFKSAAGSVGNYVNSYGHVALTNVPAGSILLAGENGVIKDDFTSLTWDATNRRLGIGEPVPAYKLSVRSDTNDSTPIASFYAQNETQAIQIGWNYVTNSSAGNPITLQTGGGKTGVYETNPQAQLHVTSHAASDVTLLARAAASPSVDLLQLQNNSAQVTYGHDKLGRPYTGNTTPSLTAGSGAGTGPTVGVAGTDVCGVISVTTGSGSPAGTAVVVTLTFSVAYAAAPKMVLLTPANQITAARNSTGQVYVDSAGITTGKFDITSGGTGLAATTTYKWYYQVLG